MHTSEAKRRVSFATQHDMRNVIRRDDMTKEDFSSMWYCKDDFKAMKKDYIPTLKKMAKEMPLDQDEEPRGLEHKTPKGNKKRHKNRLASVDAVLREQDRQWERNRGNQGFISELYMQASAHCQIEASLKAKDDAEYVKRILEEESYRDVIQECGESTLSLDWYDDQPHKEVADRGSVADSSSPEATTVRISRKTSCSDVELEPSCIILTVS